MNTDRWIWLDGKLVPSAKATVNVLSHALHYGSGVFEGIRAYDVGSRPAIFRLQDHIDRLFRSAEALRMRIPYSKQAITEAIKSVIKKNKLDSCYIRPLVFYGEGQMALMPKGAALHIMIAAWPWGAYLGEHAALSLGISRYIRFHPHSIVPGAKITGYYATSVLATIDARARGFDEALLLDHEGFVAEGPGENIFMVKRRKLFIPKSPSILHGITRASVVKIAQDLRIPVVEKKITRQELMWADEVFLTGTAAEVAPVTKIDKKKIGDVVPGPVTSKIRTAYQDAIHDRLPRYKGWLTRI